MSVWLILFLLTQDLQAYDNDGCPQKFRRCNDECLDRHNNHTIPCEQGPWGKCLSANFPFFCPLTNTCMRKDEICGEDCFDGSPDSLWYDHWENTKKDMWDNDNWVKKDNDWLLEGDANDTMKNINWNIQVPIWLERYNCNGECKTYMEECNGACDHPEGIMKGGITLKSYSHTFDLVKCGKQCREKRHMGGFHDCGDECLSDSMQCNGICPNSTYGEPQWKCGNECRPSDEKWRGCPDGSCRDKGVLCDGPLPGSCPADQVLCRYSSWMRETDYECRSNESYYVCNETEQVNPWGGREDSSCNSYSEQCHGECTPGYMKCLMYGSPSCGHPDEFILCGEVCEPNYKFHHCDGACIEKTELCHGVCSSGYKKCGEKCVENYESLKDCNGKCQSDDEPCNGECSPGYFIGGGKCVEELYKYQYYECEGAFLDMETPCNGVCHGSRMKCRGDRCLDPSITEQCEGEVCIHREEACHGNCSYSSHYPIACGNKCIREDEPCEGKCLTEKYPFFCTAYYGDTCIAIEKIGDFRENCKDGSDETTACFKSWRCNGTPQCITQPCHAEGQDKCLQTVEKADRWGQTTTYKMYYCAEEDQCKLEGVPCNGQCVTDIKTYFVNPTKPKNQFACHDGSKCVDWRLSFCNGKQDCPDGSDEICECEGKTDCKDRIQIEGPMHSKDRNKYTCKTGDQNVLISQYCDGLADCADGSDEEGCDVCPGLIRCENAHFTCVNIPCNNSGPYLPNYEDDLPDFTCEANFERGRWGLCEEKGKEPRCVRVAGGGRENFHNGKLKKGELCNDECLDDSYRCGDECLPKNYDGKPQFACNGSCDHLNKNRDPSDKLSPCGEYCVNKDELNYSGHYKNALICDGECRYWNFYWEDIKKVASRKTCNGTCLSGDGDEPWFSCKTGDQCFSKDEWCNGVSECDDGTDEANCKVCPEIKHCENENHPLTNQTSSNGPRLSDYVCSNEPCGECSDSDTFPCGNTCIPLNKTCPLSGLCSPSMFQCGDLCLPLADVCDGKSDCVDGSDEESCVEKSGSWLCQGKRQPRSQPCY